MIRLKEEGFCHGHIGSKRVFWQREQNCQWKGTVTKLFFISCFTKYCEYRQFQTYSGLFKILTLQWYKTFEFWIFIVFPGLAIHGRYSLVMLGSASYQPHDHISKQLTHKTILDSDNHFVFQLSVFTQLHEIFFTLL